MNMYKNSGHTLIEVLLVLAFILIILALTFNNMMDFDQMKVLDQSADEAQVLIEDVQTKSSSGASYENNQQNYGVVFSSDSITQFTSPSGYQQRYIDLDYQIFWPKQIICEQISLPNNCINQNDCIIFYKGTGLASSSGFLRFRDINSNYLKTLTINDNGLVTKQ